MLQPTRIRFSSSNPLGKHIDGVTDPVVAAMFGH